MEEKDHHCAFPKVFGQRTGAQMRTETQDTRNPRDAKAPNGEVEECQEGW